MFVQIILYYFFFNDVFEVDFVFEDDDDFLSLLFFSFAACFCNVTISFTIALQSLSRTCPGIPFPP